MSETVEDVLAKGGQDTDPAEGDFGDWVFSCTAAGFAYNAGERCRLHWGYGTSASTSAIAQVDDG
jgi:hypothetical protein